MNNIMFLLFFMLLAYGVDTSTLSRIQTPIDIRSESGNVYFTYDLYAELPDHDPVDAGRTVVTKVEGFKRVDDVSAKGVVKLIEFDPSSGMSERIVCKDLPPKQRCNLNVKPGQRYLVEYTLIGGKIEYMKTERINIGVFKNQKGEIEVMIFTSPVGVDLGKITLDRINSANPDSIFLMLLFLGIFGGAMYARGMGMFAGIFDLLYPRLPTPKVVPSHKAGSINYAPAISDISKIDVAEALNTSKITVRTIDGSHEFTINSIQLDIAKQLGLVTRVSGTNQYYITANRVEMLRSFLNMYDRHITPYLKDVDTVERLKENSFRQQFYASLKDFIQELKSNGFNPQYVESVEHYVMFAQGQLTAAAVIKRTREEPLDPTATLAQMYANLLTSSPNPILRAFGYLIKPALIGLVFYPFRASRGLIAIINQVIYPFKMIRRHNDPLTQITDHHHAEVAEEKINEANEALKNLEQRNVAGSIRSVFGQNIISDNAANTINNLFSKIPKSIFDALVFPTMGFGIAIGASVKSSAYRVMRYWYMPVVHKEIQIVSPNNVAEAMITSLQTTSRNISTIVLYSYIARRYPELFNRLREIVRDNISTNPTQANPQFNLDYNRIRGLMSELETLRNDRELNELLTRIYEIQRLEIAASFASEYSIYAIDDARGVRSILNQLIELVDRYYEPVTGELANGYSRQDLQNGLASLRDFLATVRYTDNGREITNVHLLNPNYRDNIDSHLIAEYMRLLDTELNDIGFRSIYKPMTGQLETSVAVFNDTRDGFIALLISNMLEMHRASMLNMLIRSENNNSDRVQLDLEIMPGLREGFDLTVLKLIGKEDVTTESHLYARMLYGNEIRRAVELMRNDNLDESIIRDVVTNVVLDTAFMNISSESVREGMYRWNSGRTTNELSSYVAEMLNREFNASPEEILDRSDRIVRRLMVLNDLSSTLGGSFDDRQIIQIFEDLRTNIDGKTQNEVSNYLNTSFRSSLESRGIASEIITGLIGTIQMRLEMTINPNSTWSLIPTENNTGDAALVKHLVQRDPQLDNQMRAGLLHFENEQHRQAVSQVIREGMIRNFERRRLAIDIMRGLTDIDPNHSFRDLSDREIFDILSHQDRITDTFSEIPHLELLSGSYKYTQFAAKSKDSNDVNIQIIAQMHQTEQALYFANREELIAAATTVAEHNPDIATTRGLSRIFMPQGNRNEDIVGAKIRDIPIIYAVTKNNQRAVERVGEGIRYLTANKGVFKNQPVQNKGEWMQQEVEKSLLATSPLIQNVPYAKRHLAHTLGAFILTANYLNLHQVTVQTRTPEGNVTRNSVLPSDLNVRTVHDILKGHGRARRFTTSHDTIITTKRTVHGMGGHTVWIDGLFNDLDTIIVDDELRLMPKTFGVNRDGNQQLFKIVTRERVTDEQLASQSLSQNPDLAERAIQLEQSISKIPSSAYEAPAAASVFILDPILGRFVHVDQDARDYGSRMIGRLYTISLSLSPHFGLIMNHYNIPMIDALNAMYYGISVSGGMNRADMMYSLHTAFFDRYHFVLTRTFIPSNAAFREQLVNELVSRTGMSVSQINQILNQHIDRARIWTMMQRDYSQLGPIIHALEGIYNTESLSPTLRVCAKVLYDEFQSRIALVSHIHQLLATDPTQISNSAIGSRTFQRDLEIFVRNNNLTKIVFMNMKNHEIAGGAEFYQGLLHHIDATVNDKRVLGITGLIGVLNLDNYEIRNLIMRGMILDTTHNIGERMEVVVSELSTNIPQAFAGTITNLLSLNIPGAISSMTGGRPYYIQGITLRNRISATIRDIRDFMLINKTLTATEYANMYFVNVEHYGHAAAMIQHAYPTIRRMFDLSEQIIVQNIEALMQEYNDLNEDHPNYEAIREYIAERLIEEFEELNELEAAFQTYQRGYYMNAWALVVRSSKGVWAGVSEFRGADISATFYAGSGLFWPYYIATMYRVLDQPSILSSDGGIRSLRLTHGVYTNLLPQYDPTLFDLVLANPRMRLFIANYFANRYDDPTWMAEFLLLRRAPDNLYYTLYRAMSMASLLGVKSWLQPISIGYMRDIIAHNYMISMFSRLEYFSRLYRGIYKSYSTTSTIDTPGLRTRFMQDIQDPDAAMITKFTSAKQFNRYPPADLPFIHARAYLPLLFSGNEFSYWYPLSFYSTLIGMTMFGLPFGYVADNIERVNPYIVPALQNWLNYRATKIRPTEGLLVSDWEEKLLTYRPSLFFHHWLSPFVGTYYDLPGYGHIDQASGKIVMGTLNERILQGKDLYVDRYNLNLRRWARYHGYYEERAYYSDIIASVTNPFMMFPSLYLLNPLSLALRFIPSSPLTAYPKALIEDYLLPYTSLSGVMTLGRKTMAYALYPFLPTTVFRTLASDMISESRTSLTRWNPASDAVQYVDQIVTATGYNTTPESYLSFSSNLFETSMRYYGVSRYRNPEVSGQDVSENTTLTVAKIEMLYAPVTGRDVIWNNRLRQLYTNRTRSILGWRASSSKNPPRPPSRSTSSTINF